MKFIFFFFLFLSTSCTQLKISSSGGILTHTSEPTTKEHIEFEIKKEIPFYLYGAYPRMQKISFDKELLRAGFVDVTQVSFEFKQTIYQHILSWITLGMYLPHTVYIYGYGREKTDEEKTKRIAL
ncbi:MAG: hypothetical protein H6622_09510 [Halobacteriovoraceae bacterium]|nr:hypothetical protein [Halobacteriovoraceae bacterium]